MSRKIENALEYAHPGLYRRSLASTVVGDVSFASLTGTLGQLGLLAHYSGEVFSSLFEEAERAHGRLDRAKARIADLRRHFRDMTPVLKRSDDLATSGRQTNNGSVAFETTEKKRLRFDESTMPRVVRERYDTSCEKLPDFRDVDGLLATTCRERYSDPNFFLKEWASAELERIQQLQEAKKKKKNKKKVAITKQPTQHPRKTVSHSLNWKKRYGVEDEIRRPPSSGLPLSSAPAVLATTTTTGTTRSGGKTMPPPPPPPSSSSESGSKGRKLLQESPQKKKLIESPPQQLIADAAVEKKKKPPPPPMPMPMPSPMQPAPPSPKAKPPPPPMPMAATPLELRPAKTGDLDEEDAPLREQIDYTKFARMLKMHVPRAAVEAKMRAEGLDPSALDDDSDDDDDEPPPPIKTPLVPPPLASPEVVVVSKPPPPPSFAAKTPEVKEPPPQPPPKNDLLSAIRGQGVQLKKRAPVEKKEAPQSGGLLGSEVDKILSLRQKVAVDDDSDDSDDDDDWDDDD